MASRQVRAGPDKSAGCCAPPRGEDADTFRVKLRTDMIQVVRDQHDMLQSWACQWERKSMAQMDEVAKLLGELKSEVQDLKAASATRKEKKKSNYLSTKIDDLEKFGSILLSTPSGPGEPESKEEQKRPSHTPHAHAHGVTPAAELFEADAFELTAKDLLADDDGKADEAGRTAGSAQSRREGSIAATINSAAETLLEDPAVYFWNKLCEQFPWLKTNMFAVAVRNAVLWLQSDDAIEPERVGLLASIESHPGFEGICMLVIFMNTWTILLSANASMANLTDGEIGWLKTANYCFTAFYSLEIAIKVAVHRLYFFINESRGWNIFDTALVAGAVFELVTVAIAESGGRVVNPVILRGLRLLKMVKIFRVLRVIMFFKELRLMMKCVVGSMASLFWGTMMLTCFTMLFAIYFVQQISNYLIDNGEIITPRYEHEAYLYYGSVEIAMMSLFRGVSGGWDWNTTYPAIAETGSANGAIFILYILLVWISLSNIITSIFVEKALTFAQPTQEEVIYELHSQDRDTATVLKRLFQQGDKDQSSKLSHEEFMECLREQALGDYLTFKGIEIKDAQAFFRMLVDVSPTGEVDIKTIIGGLVSLKGEASNIDIMLLSNELSGLRDLQEEIMDKIALQRKLLLAIMQQGQDLQEGD